MAFVEYVSIAFPAIFVILNPIMAATSFMSMTLTQSPAEQLRTARRTCTTIFIALIVFAVAGHLIFQMFRITVEAFRIAGGIILFQVGLNMLRLQPLRIKQTEEERLESLKREGDIAIVPLGIPIICGPGSITTVIVLTSEIQWQLQKIALMESLGLFFSITASCVIFYYILTHAPKFMGKLKKTGIGVMTRIMGLILSVIATQFVINGIKGLIPKFAALIG